MAQRLGVVLAGGVGRRMGRTKGDLEVDGRPLAERAARTLAPVCGSVLISVAPGAVNPAPNWTAVEDAPPAGRGPLAGLHAAFLSSGSADLVVLACDYPAATTELLRAVLAQAPEDADCVFPTDPRGRDHPLVGLWRRAALDEIEASLASNIYKVRAVLAGLRVHRVHPADLFGIDVGAELRNMNEMESAS
ncbi:MAG TPA: molybdenum cofactor guanylyltransferase [Candidatus Polarisedimenticolaceae bacterium]|nr:molybdenum cofactor guanylyltransferase [Candidatus Polarisedimenticolaceae bacterium]